MTDPNTTDCNGEITPLKEQVRRTLNVIKSSYVEGDPCQYCGIPAAGDVPLCTCVAERAASYRALDLPEDLKRAVRDMVNPKLAVAFEDYLNRFERDYRPYGFGLWIRGPKGTGKSFGISILARELIDRFGVSVRYVNVVDMFFALQGTTVSTLDAISRFRTGAVLIVDDIGKERPTEWKAEILYGIVEYRHANLLPTIYTTNLSGKEIIARFRRFENIGEYLVDRINQRSIAIVLEGESMRKAPE